YADPKTGIRQSVHADFGKGIWCPEVILTDNPGQSESGLPVYKWFRRPSGIYLIEKGGSRKENLITGKTEEKKAEEKRYEIEIDGEIILYECPPSGWAVPATSGRFMGYLRHPHTGAAVATVLDRSVAVDAMEAYIRRHESEFAGWDMIESTLELWRSALEKEKFERLFGNADLPRKMAITETSWQYSPSPNSGVSAVRRDFWDHEYGPLSAVLDGGLGRRTVYVGARPRSK
ncbi:MAG: hypothetical protein HYW25_04785, partial [Candidatus Aenigmarchaeota archaeon]|nr:hypothetical protein [Candidatus Aenigmarchaeota archaeon]